MFGLAIAGYNEFCGQPDGRVLRPFMELAINNLWIWGSSRSQDKFFPQSVDGQVFQK